MDVLVEPRNRYTHPDMTTVAEHWWKASRRPERNSSNDGDGPPTPLLSAFQQMIVPGLLSHC